MRKFRTKQSISVAQAPVEVELMRYGLGASSQGLITVTTEPGVDAYLVHNGERIEPVINEETGVWEYSSIGNEGIAKFVTSNNAKILSISGTAPGSRRTALLELNCDAISAFPDITSWSGRYRSVYVALRGAPTSSALEFASLINEKSFPILVSMTEEQDAAYISAGFSNVQDSSHVLWKVDGDGWTYSSRPLTNYGLPTEMSVQAWNAMQTCELSINQGYSLYFSEPYITLPGTHCDAFSVLSKSLAYGETTVDQEDLLANSAIELVNATVTIGPGEIYNIKPTVITQPATMLYDANMTAALAQDAQTAIWYPQTIEGLATFANASQNYTFAVLTSSRGGQSAVANVIGEDTGVSIACLINGVIGSTTDGYSALVTADAPETAIWPASAQNANMRWIWQPSSNSDMAVSVDMPVYVRGFALELQNLANQSATGGGFYLTGASGSINILNASDKSQLATADFTNSSQIVVIDSNFFVDSSIMADGALFQVSGDYTPSASNPILMPVAGANVAQDFSAAALALDLNELNRIGKLADIFSVPIAGAAEYGFGFSALHLKTESTELIAEAVGHFDGLASVLTTNSTLTIEVDTADTLASAQTAYAALTNPPSQAITFALHE